MSLVQKILTTDPKQYPVKTKAIIFVIFMASIISFLAYLAYMSFDRGSEDFKSLTRVEGELENFRVMKVQRSTKWKTYYKDVLILKIDGYYDQFGFMEYEDIYSDLTTMVNLDEKLFIEIYYDRSRQRIEEGVTLHTFDMTINGKKYISIKNLKSLELKGAVICSILVVLLSIFSFWAFKRIIRKGVII